MCYFSTNCAALQPTFTTTTLLNILGPSTPVQPRLTFLFLYTALLLIINNHHESIMPIRNPFARRQADEGALRPPLPVEPALKSPPAFERVDTVGSKASSAISVTSRQSQDTGAYKMSGTHQFPIRPPPPFAGCRRQSKLQFRTSIQKSIGYYADSFFSTDTVVNDSGVYLPPSPTVEKEQSWPRRYLSRTSTDTRSDLGEIEHFGISRESFDSYRRSFVSRVPHRIAVHSMLTDCLFFFGYRISRLGLR